MYVICLFLLIRLYKILLNFVEMSDIFWCRLILFMSRCFVWYFTVLIDIICLPGIRFFNLGFNVITLAAVFLYVVSKLVYLFIADSEDVVSCSSLYLVFTLVIKVYITRYIGFMYLYLILPNHTV